ncbi:MAG: mandelate racemase/muconate lactonizing enzyme family protein [Flavobacteriaceae bacterium TMED121]|nr:MAG: mandelate racemase/muconate lactonizing enzyme family protein [Flavobacteriaceae bacterium TMED121]
MDIKITQIESESFEWERPGIWNGMHFYGPGRLHKVTISTDQGIEGIGWNGGTAAVRPNDFYGLYVDYYKSFLIGKNPLDTANLTLNLGQKQDKILGSAGLHTQVLAAIIIACWDIKGKVKGQSIHSLLGGEQKRVRAYIAGGYYAKNKGINELQEELLHNVENLNATAVKIKIGDPNAGMSEDMKRIEAARNAIGPDIDLLVDANCAFDLSTALAYAREMENYNIYWFEEPLAIHDFKAHKTLNASTSLMIATGENYYTLADFETLIENNGASMLNVDATICPGYDVALKVAKLAQKKGLKIAPHGCQELQLPLVAAVSNGELLEYYPPEVDELRKELFYPKLTLDSDGYVTVPNSPGIGFDLNMDLLNRYRVR